MNAKQPNQNQLDAHHGYIYRIVCIPTGYVYVGKHHHNKGEAWRDYLGSAFRLQADQDFFGKEYFVKELVEWTDNDVDAEAKEMKHIAELVRSGADHYNFSNFDGALFATRPEHTRAMTAHRLSFEPWKKLKALRSHLLKMQSSGAGDPELFTEQLEVIEKAVSIFLNRVDVKAQIEAGSIAPPVVKRKRRRSTPFVRSLELSDRRWH